MSMNKLFFSVVSLLALTSCASEYKIEGSSSVSRLDGKMLFIKVFMGYLKWKEFWIRPLLLLYIWMI